MIVSTIGNSLNNLGIHFYFKARKKPDIGVHKFEEMYRIKVKVSENLKDIFTLITL